MQIGSALGAQYDFTNMTNAELLRAAKSLHKEGKISDRSEAELIGVASGVDYAEIDRSSHTDGVAKSLADTTQKDFLAYLQHAYQGSAATPGSKGSEIYLNALNELSKYQTSSAEPENTTVS